MNTASVPPALTRHDPDTDWSGLARSPETRQMAEAARAHFSSLFSIQGLRQAFDGADPADRLWPVVVEYGYSAVGLPEGSGGLGTIVDLVAILEEAGRSIATVPLMSTVSTAQTLLAAGEWPDDLAELPRSVAVATSGTTEALVLDGDRVAEAVVLSTVQDGVSVRRYRLDPRAAEPDPIDPSRPLVRVQLSPSRCTAERFVGVRIDDILAPARICVAADLLGVADLALKGAIAHVLVREQFGRLVGSFQAVKHLLANAYVELERARSLVAGAAARLAAQSNGATGSTTQLSLLAKAAASESALHATGLQVQLLGAMGLTFESDAPFALRRAQQTARHLGGAAEMYATAAGLRMVEETPR